MRPGAGGCRRYDGPVRGCPSRRIEATGAKKSRDVQGEPKLSGLFGRIRGVNSAARPAQKQCPRVFPPSDWRRVQKPYTRGGHDGRSSNRGGPTDSASRPTTSPSFHRNNPSRFRPRSRRAASSERRAPSKGLRNVVERLNSQPPQRGLPRTPAFQMQRGQNVREGGVSWRRA